VEEGRFVKRSRRLRTIGIIIAATALVAFFFPKRYDSSGGVAGRPHDTECRCLGVKYKRFYGEGFDYYCAGIPYSCHSLGRRHPRFADQ
jgi:hypothetical protein